MHLESNLEPCPNQDLPLFVRVPDALEYCPWTGDIRWLDRPDIPAHVNARLVGRIAGSANARGYRYIGLDGHVILASHVAFVLMTGRRPLNVTHVDGDLANLKWSNLREVTDSELRVSQDKREGTTSTFKGVSVSGSKSKPWRAQIGSLGRCIDLGSYETEEGAAAAYIAAKAVHHAPEVIGVAGIGGGQ